MKQTSTIGLPVGGVITKGGTALANKTGSWRSMRPNFNKEKCIHCMLCTVYCPDRAILIKDEKRLETNLDYCKGCGICAQVCPVKCISMISEEEAQSK